MLNVKNLKDEQSKKTPILNVLLYGDAGVGKSTMAASISQLGKTLLIDAEAGSQFLPEKYAKNIDVLKIKDIDELDDVLTEENVKEYSCVILDSITELAKKMTDKIKGEKEMATLQDWGKIIVLLENYFRKFRDLNKHCVLVALAQEKDDEGMVIKRPSLSGKSLPADITGFQDLCLYLEVQKNGERFAYTQPSPKFWSKDRT